MIIQRSTVPLSVPSPWKPDPSWHGNCSALRGYRDDPFQLYRKQFIISPVLCRKDLSFCPLDDRSILWTEIFDRFFYAVTRGQLAILESRYLVYVYTYISRSSTYLALSLLSVSICSPISATASLCFLRKLARVDSC